MPHMTRTPEIRLEQARRIREVPIRARGRMVVGLPNGSCGELLYHRQQ
jgi:hypothetical protein